MAYSVSGETNFFVDVSNKQAHFMFCYRCQQIRTVKLTVYELLSGRLRFYVKSMRSQ